MAVATADHISRVTELCDEAFEAFCTDVSSMFGADLQCRREHAGIEAVTELRRRFKKLAAVHLVQATGLLDGTFQLLFDQGGLFVLSGVVVMLPETRILEQVKNGHIDDAENLTDAAREVGNLLVGSWDRVFREDCREHEHFVKTSTYIGKPWDHLDEVALSADGDVWLAVYEMTVDSYPSFHCAVLLPKALLGNDAGAGAETAKPEAAQPEPEPAAQPAAKAQPAPPVEAEEQPADQHVATEVEVSQETPAQPPTADPVEAAPPKPQEPQQEEEPVVTVDEPEMVEAPAIVSAEKPKDSVESKVRESAAVRGKTAPVESLAAPVAPPAGRRPSGVSLEDAIGILSDERAAALIDQVFEEQAVCPPESGIRDLLDVAARDIMTKDVVWCDPDDAVRDVITAMQQHNTGYVLVGRDEVLEGLVSNSNILGALSPYLRPTFAKWRRPEDDATLGIKIKWIMTRPVRTIKPDVSLASAIENMRRYGGRCLPVMDKQGKIQGLITVFDILLRVLEADGSSSWQGSPPQGPPLMI
ncbi:MAG: CBS domain-containing protein [Sedimentisphaerales bacterium]|nr:CBS domain-containing protein [Sedimentisphaerales bacterium]